MKTLKSALPLLFATLQFCITDIGNAQNSPNQVQHFDKRERQIVILSSFTAKGDLTSLNQALSAALDSGLTVNEIKEVLVHLYAYAGFPRSLQGINTLITVLDNRKAKGITDNMGKTSSPVIDSVSRYERGKRVLELLTGQKETGTKTGYAALSPEIEVFLKEHLFADLFTRNVISYADRELATISALVNLGGVEPMMQSHMRIALNLGFTETQLSHLLSVIEQKVGKQEAEAGRKGLQKITGKSLPNESANNGVSIYAKGVRAPANNFTGTVWVNMVVQPADSFSFTAGVVTFEPGARSNWHMHPDGQVLLITNGKGHYQEKGSPVKAIHKGDVIKCPAGVEHWHGASPDTEMSHIAASGNFEKGSVIWLKKVTDQQYRSLR